MSRNPFKLVLLISILALPTRFFADSEFNDEPEYRRKKCKKFCRIIAESANICRDLTVSGATILSSLTVGGVPFGSLLAFGGVAKVTDPIVAPGGILPFDFFMPSFNETPTTTGLTLTNAGTYFYLFKVQAGPVTLGTEFNITLYSNGVAVPGSTARSGIVVAPVTDSQAIGAGIATFPAGAALSLVNTSTVTITITPPTPVSGASEFLIALRLS